MNTQLSNALSTVIWILFLMVIVAGLVYGIFRLIRLLLKIKKLNHPEIIKYYLLMIICFFIMAASWIFNIGWYRLILTLLAFPIVHYVLFAIVDGKALLKLFLSKKLKIYTLISYTTYIISYLSFPDGGDYGPMYVFFGLINNNDIAKTASVLCVISFIAHIIVSIFQLIEMSKIKRYEHLNSELN